MRWGGRGRKFKSCQSDKKELNPMFSFLPPVIWNKKIKRIGHANTLYLFIKEGQLSY
jgi:hypothetical protein